MNSAAVARTWVDFLAVRPEIPWGQRLVAAFDVGEITRLCDCGCNSFDLVVPAEASVAPIARAGGSGAVFDIAFKAQGEGPPDQLGSLELVVFADTRGHFAGVEVDYCANSYPVPAHLVVADAPYHVSTSAAVNA